MVGVINPNSSTSIDKQRSLALDSAYMLNPGEPFPAESPLPSNIPSSSGHDEIAPHKHPLAPGAIAGTVIGAISVVILAALLFFYWGRTKTLRNEVERKQSTVARRLTSSAGMLQTSNGGTGLGIFQHYSQNSTPTSPEQSNPFSTPPQVPPYFPPTRRYDSPAPIGHPAFSSAQQAYATDMHRAGSHRSVGGTFELSPSGSYARTYAHASPYMPSSALD